MGPAPLKVCFLAVLLFRPGLFLTAQKNFLPGTIIDRHGDTLRGEIDFRDWQTTPARISFRQADSSEVRELDAMELLSFEVNAERYESRRVRVFPYSRNPESLSPVENIGKAQDTTLFLQVLITGKLTLWEYRFAGGIDYFFVNGEGGSPEQLRLITRLTMNEGLMAVEKEELFKNQLAYLLKDCPVAAQRASAARYNAESLERLIFIYNTCGRDTVEKAVDPGRVQLFPLLGYVSSRLRFSGYPPEGSQHYPDYSGIAGGFGALFILPRKRQQLSIAGDLLWQHFHSTSNTVAVNSFTTETGHIDYSLLKVEILFRYRYPARGARPFIETGMANSVTFGANDYQTTVDALHHSTSNDPLLGGSIRQYLEDWILGAGVSGKRWTLEGRFEAGPGISDAYFTGSPTTSLYVLLSYAL